MKVLTAAAASARFFRCTVIFGLVTTTLIALHFSSSGQVSAGQVRENGLTTHEWGTFTSVSDSEGRAIHWLPLSGSTDLPSFVERLGNVNFKGGLLGTMRMETPPDA